MINIMKKLTHIGAIVISFAPLFVQADDTEIYLGSNSDKETKLPNVIFVMDTSGSMAWNADGQDKVKKCNSRGYYCNWYDIPDEDQRLSIVKKVAIEVIEEIANDPEKDFNISLMDFNYDEGASVKMAMSQLKDSKDTFETKMNALVAYGGTPITESLDEALRYLRGDDIKYGDLSETDSQAYSNNKYKSPVENECQANHIVLFSDGAPTLDGSSDTSIKADFDNLNHPRKTALLNDNSVTTCNTNTSTILFGSKQKSDPSLYWDGYENRTITFNRSYYSTYYGQTVYEYSYQTNEEGSCAEELALLGQTTDLISDTTISGFQNVTFHTVGGFSSGDALDKLKNIARYGTSLEVINGVEQEQMKVDDNGDTVPKNYYAANDAEGLKAQLSEIFNFIVKDDSTFTAPAISVNSFNRLQHQEELYYSVFSPSKNANWKGNLKRYRLGDDGTIYDSNDAAAVDSTTGFFKDSSQSFWTLGTPDGKAVDKGGIASRFALPADINASIKEAKGARIVTSNLDGLDLINSKNRVHPDNDSITNSDLGLTSSTSDIKRESILKWAAGIDVNNEDDGVNTSDPSAEFKDPRPFMEDPLHSQPVIINYYKDASAQTTDRTVFISTNSGYLHAFSPDKDNPSELFSFIPKILLKNIPLYYDGEPGKAYGLDGPLSYFHNDLNHNDSLLSSTGSIESSTVDGSTVKEYIHLYASMRRGGRNYYALDISDRSSPKFLWQINGGEGKFNKLGQTWSKMIPATVNWEGKETKVLFFGGGYDDEAEDCITNSDGTLNCYEGPAKRTSVSKGNAIFMVDAETGKYLWSASDEGADLNLPQMENSIVADLVVLDTDEDGLSDLIYSSDTGGRIWRLDLKTDSNTLNTDIYGGMIADMNEGGSNNVRFYNTIDLAYMYDKDSGVLPHFQLSIGSGYRAHPLDKRGVNRFYLINDYNVTNKPTAGSESSFYVTTYEKDLVDIESSATTTPTTKPKGKYLILKGNGEKVLASSTTAAGHVFFTTYRPNDGSTTINCAPSVGIAKLYHLIPDGSSIFVESKDLAQTGIPPQPVLLFPPSPPETGSDDEDDDGNGEEDESDNNSCGDSAPVIATGAEITNSGIDKCGQITKTYWKLN